MPGPYFPSSATGLSVVTYPAGPTATGTTVTAAGSANTKGSYTQLVASIGVTTNRVTVTMTHIDEIDGLQMLIDLATGAGGAEVVQIPNLGTDNAEGGGSGIGCITIPWEIPIGTRVAARCQASSMSAIVALALTCCATGGMRGVTTMTNYGANTADSGGTQVDPGGTANVKGSYAQLSASTSGLLQWALLDVTGGGDSTFLSVGWAVDLATGSGGAESVLWSDVRCGRRDVQVSAFNYAGRLQGFLTYIAAGTRIAARASASQNDASARKIDVSLIGGQAPQTGGPWIYYEQQWNQAA